MAELKEGSQAPKFSLINQHGEKVSLSSTKEDYVVLFFYPKDNTPGCTIEAKSFSENLKKFNKLNVKVLGISGGDQKSKQKFCEKGNLETVLLSDEDAEIGKKYGAYGPKSFMGKKFNGFIRKTFIIGKDRKILKIYNKVKPAEHVEEVLEYLKSLTS